MIFAIGIYQTSFFKNSFLKFFRIKLPNSNVIDHIIKKNMANVKKYIAYSIK